MAIPEPTVTGYAPFGSWQTWYRITGDLGSRRRHAAGRAARRPRRGAQLHAAHGAGSRSRGRAVIHYDQLGLRQLDAPARQGRRLLDRRSCSSTSSTTCSPTLGIADGYHLLGQSWGGMLGAEHAVRPPAGLRVARHRRLARPRWSCGLPRRTSCAPSCRRTSRTRSGVTRRPVLTTIRSTDAATKVFNDRHVCRVVPNPPEVIDTDNAIAGRPDRLPHDERAERVPHHRDPARLVRGRPGSSHHGAHPADQRCLRRGDGRNDAAFLRRDPRCALGGLCRVQSHASRRRGRALPRCGRRCSSASTTDRPPLSFPE